MLKPSISYWQLLLVAATILVLVPGPHSRIDGRPVSLAIVAAVRSGDVVETTRTWAVRAETNATRALVPPAAAMRYAFAEVFAQFHDTATIAMAPVYAAMR